MMEIEERGYGESDQNICRDCVSDPFLAEWIKQNASSKTCDFCGAASRKPIAASFEGFAGLVVGGIAFDWSSPEHEGVMYISAEGGWMAELTDTLTVLQDAEISENWDVLEALSDIIARDQWVPRDVNWGTEREHLNWGWDAFKEHTKHHTRYFFQQEPDQSGHDVISPANLLGAISTIILSKLSQKGIIGAINSETDLYRIRVDDKAHSSATSLGTPKAEYAKQSNRMSPAGVPMFYGALDKDTAIAETVDLTTHGKKIASLGVFRAERELAVLNLSELPSIPSIFDTASHEAIHSLRFLHDFAKDFSKPIARDGREHIEYVPTQIVTEYFRRVFTLSDGRRIDGIVYKSAKQGAGKAIVLFCENAQCADVGEKKSDTLLRLRKVETK
jgi:hypothetical protein